MMDYLWSKFQQIRAIFGGERANKPPKGAHLMAAASPRNNLKIYNFGTTNGMKMKLATIMYHHKTFHFPQKLGRHPHVIRRRRQKTSEKKLKKRFFGFFSPVFQDFKQNIIRYDTLLRTASLVQIWKESDKIWRSYTQKTTQKQPKIHFSGPSTTFENW